MVTYNNIVKAFSDFVDNHFILRSFSHGGVDDQDLNKIEEYPYLHLVYTGSDYSEGLENMGFEVYIMGQPSDKVNKTDYQKEVISDLKQCAEDVISDINLGANVFKQVDDYDLVSATISPLEEEESNVLCGVLLNITISIPWTSDSCNLPLTGVTPTPISCEPATVTNGENYTQEIASGETFTLPKIRLQEVNGSEVLNFSAKNLACSWFDIVVKDQSSTTLGTISTYPVGGEFSVTCPTSDATVENSDSSYSDTVGAGATLVLPDITVTQPDGTSSSFPSVQNVTCDQATNSPFIIPHRKPFYTSISADDYPDLYSSGYFDIYEPTGIVKMARVGSDMFTLAENNPFGTTDRYTSTDGTPATSGTARFASYGTGVSNVVIDWLHWIMIYNIPSTSRTWNNGQPWVDTNLNTPAVGGYTDWICGTRDMITFSCFPDNNTAAHTSPNPIIDSGTRRYITCERLPFQNSGYAVFMNGSEIYQSLTSSVSGQTRALGMRLLSQSDIDNLVP